MGNSSKKKLLLVAPYFYPQHSGGAPHVYLKIQELSHHEIRIYTDANKKLSAVSKTFDANARYPVHRVRNIVLHLHDVGKLMGIVKAGLHIIFQTSSLVWTIIKYRPQIVCCGAIRCVGWLTYFAAILTGRTLISYVHGEELTIARENGLWARFSEWGEGKVLRASARVIAVSQFTHDMIINEKGCDPRKVSIVNNGTDVSIFYPVSKSKVLADRYGVSGKKILITLTRLEEKKGVANVIRALPGILKEIPDLIYLVGGSGSEREHLKELVSDMGLNDKVFFAGFVPDQELNDFMNLGDVFILANHSVKGDTEGFGLVFLQANACGLSVIGGRDGGTPDAVQHGKTGFLIDATDQNQIIEAVVRLMSDGALRERMGIAGRARVLDCFPWQKKVRQFDDLINKLSL